MAEDYLSDEYFEIRIDFAPNEGDASRVFLAMGDMIESLQSLDRDLLSQFAVELEAELLLEDVERGSLKAKLRNLVKDVPDDALQNAEWKKIIGHFLIKAKYAFLHWTEEHDSIEDRSALEPLEGELLAAARESDVLRIPAYRAISQERLLTNVRDVSHATRRLSEKDYASFESSVGSARFNRNLAVSDETIRDLLTQEVKESVSDQTLLVKKPDYLGQSMWSFRYQTHSIDAKILDTEWLDSFHTQRVSLQPGDALRVTLREVFYYGHYGEIVSAHYEILKVIDVISIPTTDQRGLF